MGKFYGEIGYAETVETAPGVWTEQIVKRIYAGSVIRDAAKIRNGEHLNDDIILENKFSILADPYAYQNFQNIRYVNWMGTLWKISGVEVQRPRLILTIGGVYNEQKKE